MISFHGRSDVGRIRSQNEDSILVLEDLFAVCDGMGGHKAGEVASRMAVATLLQFYGNGDRAKQTPGDSPASAEHLVAAIREANREIRQMAAASEDCFGMGTTVALALVHPQNPRVTYACVGDSRIYLIRNGVIAQLSRDDSWINAAFGAGETPDEAALTSMQHVLVKALGTHDVLDFEVKTHDLQDGDKLLLCSDGLTSMVPDSEILRIVADGNADLESTTADLIGAANKAGGRDNISAVLIHYRE
ncbi:MAG TPA: protein phosphatase 2C domain-containing protein [Candidatus Binatia bacterium]|jgi:protein phosphatase